MLIVLAQYRLTSIILFTANTTAYEVTQKAVEPTRHRCIWYNGGSAAISQTVNDGDMFMPAAY